MRVYGQIKGESARKAGDYYLASLKAVLTEAQRPSSYTPKKLLTKEDFLKSGKSACLKA